MANKNKNQGFTLIEVLVALSIFIIGIVAAFSLSLHTSNTSVENVSRVMAADLAREGIELVRNVRDSNWLRIDANSSDCVGFGQCTWDYGINQSYNHIYIDYTNNDESGFNNLLSQGFGCGDSLGTCANNCSNCSLYRDTNGFYSHDNTGRPTNIRRLIRLRKICSDTSSASPDPADDYEVEISTSCNTDDTYVGLEVTSYVRFERDGKYKSVTLTDKIYNWRR